jgi:hypothetical protein
VRLARTVGHDQVPAVYDQVIGRFYFFPGTPTHTVRLQTDAQSLAAGPSPIGTFAGHYMKNRVNPFSVILSITSIQDGALKGTLEMKASARTPLVAYCTAFSGPIVGTIRNGRLDLVTVSDTMRCDGNKLNLAVLPDRLEGTIDLGIGQPDSIILKRK